MSWNKFAVRRSTFSTDFSLNWEKNARAVLSK